MISYLKGVLTSVNAFDVIIEVNNIGYLISIPSKTFGHLPAIGSSLQLFTSFIVREFSHTLYGFLNTHERDVFEILLNISGIGPKLALSIIGNISLNDLQSAIAQKNLTLLCKVPGIGKKTAERMVIELRDKLTAIPFLDSSNTATSLGPHDPKALQVQDAMMALINLGYNQHTAKKAIENSLKDLPEKHGLADLITLSLKRI
jgi:holliday junction DNA helicase RuvA